MPGARLDPELARKAEQLLQSEERQASPRSPDWIGLRLRVQDPSRLSARSDVRLRRVDGKMDDGSTVLILETPAGRLGEILASEGLLEASLNAPPADPVSALEDMGGIEALGLPDSLADGAAGVVVGFIDTSGIDYRSPQFRAGARTRLLALWDLDGEPNAPVDIPQKSGFSYEGGRYSREDIQAALDENRPLPVTIVDDAHGHAVASLAAGTSSLAAKADLIFVNLPNLFRPIVEPYWPRGEGDYEPDPEVASYGDLPEINAALRYILDIAGERPCVVNVSLGTTEGPHDGSSLFEQSIDRAVSQRSNLAVVVAAANFRDDGRLFGEWQVSDGEDDEFRVLLDDTSQPTELDIWYSGEDRLSFELISPAGERFGPIEPGTVQIFREGQMSDSLILHRRHEENGAHQFNVFWNEGVTEGRWIFKVRGLAVSNGRFYAWLYPEIGPSISLPDGISLASIACAAEAIVVGAYDHHPTAAGDRHDIALFSGKGPTRDGRQKPDICAPGVQRVADYPTGPGPANGTSFAAPLVTGTIALMLAEATARGGQLSAAEVREILRDTASPSTPGIGGWTPEDGIGRINAAAAVRAVIARFS
jgi:subtilisin family serine protease